MRDGEGCSSCESKKKIPGNCHITCINPPIKQIEIGAGGDERYDIAEKQAKKQQAIVRCIWPGSGVFPFCFDSSTVLGCHNYKK